MTDAQIIEMIDSVNRKYKYITEKNEHYNEIICYVHDKAFDAVGKFNPNKLKAKMETFMMTVIRCAFIDQRHRLKRGHELERGNCENCVVKKMQTNQ